MAAFTPDGTYRRVEGVTYRGRGRTFPLENDGLAFSDYCYPSGTIILAQLGVLGALDTVVARMPNRGQRRNHRLSPAYVEFASMERDRSWAVRPR